MVYILKFIIIACKQRKVLNKKKIRQRYYGNLHIQGQKKELIFI
jgi:polyisoprenoid-binding protein YceI